LFFANSHHRNYEINICFIFHDLAELGKGRIVVFSHDMFVKSFTKIQEKNNNERFSENIKKWVTKGNDKNAAVLKFNKCVNDIEELSPEGNIFTWNGLSFPDDKELERLIGWVNRGGGLICGVCPWGFVCIHNIEVEDMPLNYIFRKIDLAYAGKETYVGDNDETCTLEMSTESVRLTDIITSSTLDLRKCPQLIDIINHLPNHVYNMYKDHILEILKTLDEGVHCVPTKAKPVDTISGENAVALKCNLIIRDGLNGEKVIAEGIDQFPGTFTKSPELQTVLMQFVSTGYKIHPTGYYAPPGTVIDVSWSTPTKPWTLLVGLHKGKLHNVKSNLRRWPTVMMKMKMKASPTKICSPFGGLVYLESPQDITDAIDLKLDNVVAAPMFRYKTASSWESAERLKPGLWCDIIGDKIAFTLPSSSIRNLSDPTKTMQVWDLVVSMHTELRGKDTSNGRGQWVIADEQLHLDGAYMISGYPILTHLDVASPDKKVTYVG
jgi:hypothetical protein